MADKRGVLAVGLDVVGVIGSGAFGTACVVKDHSGRTLVLKAINKLTFACTTETLGQLETEWDILKSNSDCPYMLMGYYAFQTNLALCMVMEYFQGCSLYQYVEHADVIPEHVLRSITAQLSEGLNYLHIQKMIHRDVKDDNALISVMGHVKLIDYGLVVRSYQKNLLRMGAGTPCFMAPESILFPMEGKVSYASDYWSLGVTMYVLGADPKLIKNKALQVNRFPYVFSQVSMVLEGGMKRIDFEPIRSIQMREVVRAMLIFNQEERVASMEDVKKFQWFQTGWDVCVNQRQLINIPKCKLKDMDPEFDIFSQAIVRTNALYGTTKRRFPHITCNIAQPLPKDSEDYPRFLILSCSQLDARQRSVKVTERRKYTLDLRKQQRKQSDLQKNIAEESELVEESGDLQYEADQVTPAQPVWARRRVTGFDVDVEQPAGRRGTRTILEESEQTVKFIKVLLKPENKRKPGLAKITLLGKMKEKYQVMVELKGHSKARLLLVLHSKKNHASEKCVLKCFDHESAYEDALRECRVLLTVRDCPVFVSVHKGYRTAEQCILKMRHFAYLHTLEEDLLDKLEITISRVNGIVTATSEIMRKTLMKMAEERWRKVLLQILQALCILQERGICHNQITTENILIDLTNKQIKLAGFSQARFCEANNTCCIADQKQALKTCVRMYAIPQDYECDEFPNYFSDELKHILGILKEEKALSDFREISEQSYFAFCYLAAVQTEVTYPRMGKEQALKTDFKTVSLNPQQ